METCREEDIVELTNGCICCTVADDFLPTIEKLLNQPNPPDHIVIETSGWRCPSRWSKPSHGRKFAPASRWTASSP